MIPEEEKILFRDRHKKLFKAIHEDNFEGYINLHYKLNKMDLRIKN